MFLLKIRLRGYIVKYLYMTAQLIPQPPTEKMDSPVI